MDKYEIEKKIGEGAYGAVYSATVKEDFSTVRHDFRAGEKVAMKEFEVERGDGIKDDTVREVDILNRLFHRNVLSAYDTFSLEKNDLCSNIC